MQLPTPLLQRPNDQHKFNFGHTLIIGGSDDYTGAPILSAHAASRCGVGLVTLACPSNCLTAIQTRLSEVIITKQIQATDQGHLAEAAYKEIAKTWIRFQSVALGPGLGTHPSVRAFILEIIKHCPLPLTIDADALNALSDSLDILKHSPADRIVTPHTGEMSRLTNEKISSDLNHRKGIAEDFAKEFNCTVVLKGHQTVVCHLNETYINSTGNAGMATAGSGDVLTGMIAALCAQGIKPFEAAASAVYLHGLAGDLAAETLSQTAMIATDIIKFLPAAIMKASQ